MLLQATELNKIMQKIKGQKKYIYQACANLNNDGEAILSTDTIEFKANGIWG